MQTKPYYMVGICVLCTMKWFYTLSTIVRGMTNLKTIFFIHPYTKTLDMVYHCVWVIQPENTHVNEKLFHSRIKVKKRSALYIPANQPFVFFDRCFFSRILFYVQIFFYSVCFFSMKRKIFNLNSSGWGMYG